MALRSIVSSTCAVRSGGTVPRRNMRDPAEYRVERRPQLVGERREELVLRAVRAFEVAEQARAFDGEGHANRQLAGKRFVHGVERLARRQGQHAERRAAGAQRQQQVHAVGKRCRGAHALVNLCLGRYQRARTGSDGTDALLVPQDDCAGHRQVRDEIGCERGERRLAVVRGRQRVRRLGEDAVVLFDAALLGDVHHRSGGCHGAPIAVADDASTVADPACAAVRPYDAELVAELAGRRGGLIEDVAYALPVVGMDAGEMVGERSPAVGVLPAENAVHAVVVGGEMAVEVEMPRADAGCGQCGPEPLPGVHDEWVGRGLQVVAHQSASGANDARTVPVRLTETSSVT